MVKKRLNTYIHVYTLFTSGSKVPCHSMMIDCIHLKVLFLYMKLTRCEGSDCCQW